MTTSDIAQARALLRKQALPRQADLSTLFAAVRDMHCVSVVGVSNLGKSALLRSLTDSEMQKRYLGAEATGYLPIYIDLNQMLDMTEQAFYELVLRCAIDVLDAQAQSGAAPVLQRVRTAYDILVKPASDFQVPLSFAQAMAAVGDLLPQKVAFLFDELDGPVCEIDGRVFLNLRALKDKHWQGLTYVTATNRRLEQLGQDGDVAEFAELFSRHVLYISPLNDAESADFVARFAAEEGVTFSEEDLSFIQLWAGGHPGLLEAICHLLGSLTGRPVRDATQDWIIQRRAAELIPQDTNIQTECHNIWGDLMPQEHDALLSLFGAAGAKNLPGMDSLIAQRLVVGQGAERRIFARAFAEFVQRQATVRRPGASGIRVDSESGEVWVSGVQAPTLTNLEYRLLLLLYGRLGKIVTKYEVVEAVWGEDYIDDVDDARIEKLVSRLRQKLEPDAANPRFVLTVRGRGYKLAEG
jgi:hypothetical protein